MGFIIETTHELLHDLIIIVKVGLDQPRDVPNDFRKSSWALWRDSRVEITVAFLVTK